MPKQRIHLLCNAHLDPCWLWEWEEGAGETLSTFKTAVELCEQFDEFIFNHNEAILYKWVEQYSPELFKRIQQQVKKGKWNIMGGWFLQPDCNMPSGESFVRQVLIGRNYFKEKFGVEPETAINFDPFGHSRGLVQILAKSGYKYYLFGRPHAEIFSLPERGFVWKGYDGSEVIAYRFMGWYNAPLGKAREKVEQWIKEHPDHPIGLVLWGVGNHGGGPSFKDCKDLRELIQSTKEPEIFHSQTDSFFKELQEEQKIFPQLEQDLNPWAPGCYTSQIRVKQKHRKLENELYMTEKMASVCAIQGLIEYPSDEIHQALENLLFAEFHDILPGSSIPPVEDTALQILDHGLNIISRVKARCFFSLCKLNENSPTDTVPLFAYNPHPFPVKHIFEAEFCLPDFNFEDSFVLPQMFIGGKPILSQVEKEHGNVAVDWRKRMIFVTTLPPSQITQIDIKTDTILPQKPQSDAKIKNGIIEIKGDNTHIGINTQTGLMDFYRIDGKDFLQSSAFLPIVIKDNEDPWGSEVLNYKEIEGAFSLLDETEVPKICGIKKDKYPPVHITEDGKVRTVVESMFKYNNSYIVIHYKIPKVLSEIEIQVRVFWFEKDRMLKLCIPLPWNNTEYMGQVVFGKDKLSGEQYEVVSQKWVAGYSPDKNLALTIINDGIYGSDFVNNTIRLTLLHSPAYSSLPFKNRPLVPQDRFTPRMEQGERIFHFWITGGNAQERFQITDNEALAHNEKPMFLSFTPTQKGENYPGAIMIENPSIVLSAFKKSEKGAGFILRLFEPTGYAQETKIHIPPLSLSTFTTLQPFEIKTFYIDPIQKTITECSLLEERISN